MSTHIYIYVYINLLLMLMQMLVHPILKSNFACQCAYIHTYLLYRMLFRWDSLAFSITRWPIFSSWLACSKFPVSFFKRIIQLNCQAYSIYTHTVVCGTIPHRYLALPLPYIFGNFSCIAERERERELRTLIASMRFRQCASIKIYLFSSNK